ncbi:hypothetical protein BVY01_04405 [bacterium I07]|nr:hypothetical protein BVY01_04405 [bacterium I07]
MKNVVLTISLCALLVNTAFTQTGRQYVRVKNENIRAQPSGKKIGELAGGTEVEILEKQPNWVKVQVTAWIWSKSLTGDPSQVEGFKMRASHILLDSEAKANEVLVQLNQGGDFSALAGQHSIDKASGAKGGDLGEFSRGDLMPAFEESVLKLKVGEISSVVKSAIGYHIIKRTQ